MRLALALAVTGLGGIAVSGCDVVDSVTNGSPDDPEAADLRTRKNVKDLTAEEKQDFVDAVLALKASPPPEGVETLTVAGVTLEIDNHYDMFVAFHQAAVMQTKHVRDGAGVAHANPAFPPWHRKLLLLYEEALRAVSGKDIHLPYWDWTDQASTDAVLSNDFMGPAGDPDCEPDCAWAVTEGPFRKGQWELTLPTRMETYIPMHPGTWIVRAIGQYDPDFYGYPVSLPTSAEVEALFAIEAYDVPPYNPGADPTLSFRTYLEGFGPVPEEGETQTQHMHNIGHDWLSGSWKAADDSLRVGTMEPLDISPSDPVFFIHHCNVDRLWAEWQASAPERATAYEPVDGDWPDGWRRDDDMYPYSLFVGHAAVGDDITPGDFLEIGALGYTYDTLATAADR